MSDARLSTIDSTVQKTYEWLKEIREELHTDDSRLAYQALRSVLQTLRDRLPPEEAAHLAAQLPTLVRGIYYEGWRPAHKPDLMRSREEFLARVAERFDHAATYDPILLCHGVLTVLDRHISPGEINEVRGTLTKDLQQLWTQALKKAG